MLGTPHIVTLLGSVNAKSSTAKTLELVHDQLRHRGATVDMVDLRSMELPLPGLGGFEDEIAALKKRVQAADGIVAATPEYNGSYSSVMKLIIDHLGYPSALAGKPTALLGVAAGSIGAVKALEHLRSVFAHNGSLVLPFSLSIARVHQFFDESGACTDPAMEKQLHGVANELLDYLNNS